MIIKSNCQYVSRLRRTDGKVSPGNAHGGLYKENNRQLNELIAEVLLQEKKGIVKDKRLLELVKRCVE